MKTPMPPTTIAITARPRLRSAVRAGEMGAVSQAYRGDMSRFALSANRDALVDGWTQDSSTFANETYGR